jgi:hypothetical protein
LDKTSTSEFFQEHENNTSAKDECYLRTLKHSRVLVLFKLHEKLSYHVLIIYIKMFETNVVLTYVYIANRPLTKFSCLVITTLHKANCLKISLNYDVLLVLFKVL